MEVGANIGHCQNDLTLEDLRFVRWEQGGPSVAAPRGTGFGSRMIGRILAEETGGSVTLDYPETGLACTLTAPARTVADTVLEPFAKEAEDGVEPFTDNLLSAAPRSGASGSA